MNQQLNLGGSEAAKPDTGVFVLGTNDSPFSGKPRGRAKRNLIGKRRNKKVLPQHPPPPKTNWSTSTGQRLKGEGARDGNAEKIGKKRSERLCDERGD